MTGAIKVCLFCHRSDSRRALKLRECPTVMQPNISERGAHAGNGLSLTLQPELVTRSPVPGAAAANPDNNEVRVPMTSGVGESSGGASSRKCRVNSHSHSHSQSHGRSRVHHHSNSEPELDPPDSDLDSAESSTSLSELRCLFRWLQKSLPFLVILCAKLVIQHALGEYELSTPNYCSWEQKRHFIQTTAVHFSGLAVGVGLFTTFLYVNKSIQTQVFLQASQEQKTTFLDSLCIQCCSIPKPCFCLFLRIVSQGCSVCGCYCS